MTYAKFATGFKGGGFSPRPSNPLQTEPFGHEKLQTFELGAKSELMDRRVRLNGAWFYSKYTDQQTFAQQFDSSGANWFRTFNAGKATIWGLEGEIQAEPVDNLRIEGSIGYVNYELTDNEGNTLLLEGDSCGPSSDSAAIRRARQIQQRVGISMAFRRRRHVTPRLIPCTLEDLSRRTTAVRRMPAGGERPRKLAGRRQGLGDLRVRPQPDRQGVLQRQAEPDRLLRSRAGQPGSAA
jgi:outer membrane receptor protein involved in Fe transport